jgi:proton-translocating NADH-quinone oxidoreductase chain N
VNALESLTFFRPEITLLAGAFAAFFMDFFVKNKKMVGYFAVLILAAAALVSRYPSGPQQLFFGFFTLDAFTHYFRYLALGAVAVTLLISLSSREIAKNIEGEYYALFLFMAFALDLIGASRNLLMIYMSIEFVSLISYLLVGFLKKSPKSKEAAIKYFLFGSTASAVMLFGMSLLFGAAGSLDIGTIGARLTQSSFYGVSLISLILFLTGLGFKVSMAPFHLWAPDVYEAAPTPVTAFLTVAPKALGFAALIRVLSESYLWLAWKWDGLLTLLSILTMTIGNLTAISQTNVKRFLAYSSIAQAGYILMGIATFNATGIAGILIYLLAYAFTNLGAFAVVSIVSDHSGNDEMASYAGLARRSPALAACLTFFLLSLAGIPPTAGFIGKFFVFAGTIEAGFILLAVAAAVNSAVAAYYYFKIVRLMYLTPCAETSPLEIGLALKWVLAVTFAGTLVIGLYPAPVIRFIQTSLFM